MSTLRTATATTVARTKLPSGVTASRVEPRWRNEHASQYPALTGSRPSVAETREMLGKYVEAQVEPDEDGL